MTHFLLLLQLGMYARCVLLLTMPTPFAAIWDNRSVYHSMTLDYHDLGDRFGNRAVGIGERPYFDPQSKSRREDLGIAYIQ